MLWIECRNQILSLHSLGTLSKPFVSVMAFSVICAGPLVVLILRTNPRFARGLIERLLKVPPQMLTIFFAICEFFNPILEPHILAKIIS